MVQFRLFDSPLAHVLSEISARTARSARRRAVQITVAFAVALLASQPLDKAQASVILDFDGLADLEVVTTQFPGFTFSNATTLSAGISLNEFEFPPRSGLNVIFDDSGTITIDIASPATEFSGFFTYLLPITITAFDPSLIPVGTVTSAFNSNLALSGDAGSSPNELLSIAFAGGISRVTIGGDPFGGSFTADDLTFAVVQVPEPESLLLFGVGLFGLVGLGRCRRHRKQTQSSTAI